MSQAEKAGRFDLFSIDLGPSQSCSMPSFSCFYGEIRAFSPAPEKTHLIFWGSKQKPAGAKGWCDESQCTTKNR